MEGMNSPDWLGSCRRMVARQRELFAAETGIAGRTDYEGRGEGGDMTLVLDRRCEDIVFEELERLADGGVAIAAVSEERGEVELGSGEARHRVVIDPIDGSLNVRRTLPSHSLSVAVADGDSMADVHFGFVHDFGADDEFAATRGQGATLNQQPVEGGQPDHGLEVVGIESADPALIGPPIGALEGKAYRLRVVGSIAITMAYVAAGRFDAMFSARPCRSVDAAAAQLLVTETGRCRSFGVAGPGAAALDLEARYPVAAARNEAELELMLEAQSLSPALRSDGA